ncbi:MAG: hypothetical protein K9W44_08825 [Candidatus Lokiarchaeota archaeon]|nr:hypothetical protein [Candidatus Harpocratesius repetitus]
MHVFNHDRKKGWITALGGSSTVVGTAMKIILKQFRNMHITSNLIEKEFSALKKLIDFRGRRSMEIWNELLIFYFIIRDEPKILDQVLNQVNISFQTVSKSISCLLTGGVAVM